MLTEEEKRKRRQALDKAYNAKRKQYKMAYSPENKEMSDLLDKAIKDSGKSINTFLQDLVKEYLIEHGYIK